LRTWSFAAVRPAEGLCVRDGRAWRLADGAWRETRGEPWDLVRSLAGRARAGPQDAPFPHGVAGLVSYDAGRLLERLPAIAEDDARVPQVLLYRFDAAVAVPAGGAPLVRHAPGAEAAARELRALLAREPPPLPDGEVSPVRARTSPKEFEAMVTRAREHVRAGDVFQVNLSHRLEARATLPPLALYARLRAANPAPFSALLLSGPLPDDPEGFAVVSSSPERLFRLEGRRLEARPIAGTRRRGRDPREDAALAAELRADGKEQAEHVMMVDLARNDLGRVASPGSVRVPRLLAVETYRTVHHLVSTVEADLAPGLDAVDALRAMFPGGTITGAPKVRSMEVIEAIEPARRGVYTGSLGWIGPTGDCDFSILIRTLLLRRGEVHLQVGAGIVEESDPGREYQETLAKAKGLLMALGAAG
ncbi:MAG TPA: anthranilate synthase component I family protein, partial [Candidatus Thermoplasmatota archaeon]|nr:anthranilate synthase component I family protein [Candidatus Thermoplasmatota archaeon]